MKTFQSVTPVLQSRGFRRGRICDRRRLIWFAHRCLRLWIRVRGQRNRLSRFFSVQSLCRLCRLCLCGGLC